MFDQPFDTLRQRLRELYLDAPQKRGLAMAGDPDDATRTGGTGLACAGESDVTDAFGR